MVMYERLRRFLAVGALAARAYMGYKSLSLRERFLGLRDAEALRLACHRRYADRAYELAVNLKGLMIKAGQVVASRPDLIPEEYVVVRALSPGL